ncbi:hypothetical protein GGR52DRAFT_315187 [Hypoxylon sp. FL1284]|nr:hypothetical protein GGR52DRAFT_315187 [Hypoxylon sp. FL1284]
MSLLMRRAGRLFLRPDKSNKQDDDNEQVNMQRQRDQVLLSLQRTLDPLIAAQVYNSNHSRLVRLPEELLLTIISHLRDDLVSTYCLRNVSRTFRRLVPSPTRYYILSSSGYPILSEAMPHLYVDEKAKLRTLLHADGMCNKCKLSSKLRRGYRRKSDLRPRQPIVCQFDKLGDPEHYWVSCHRNSVRASRPYQIDSHSLDRARCVRREGTVPLYEHVNIS